MSIIKNIIATQTSEHRDADDLEGTLDAPTATDGPERDKRALVDKFNSGELDVLFHAKPNVTGLPSPAHKNVRDQRPRSTYIVQSDEDDVSPV